MFEKLRRDVFVDMIIERELERDAHQVERVHRHPGGAIGLVDIAAGRERGAAIEKADIVKAKKPALKDVVSFNVLAVHPPGEIEHQLMKDAFEESPVALAAVMLAVGFIDAP